MGYALGFRDPEVVGDLVLPHVGEAVGLGPRGTFLPAALWGLAMYDLSRFTEPPMEPPHPSPPPLLGHAGGSLVEDVQEEKGIAAATVDGPQSCPSPAVPGPLSEPRPTSPSPPCTQSASPELPPEVISLSDFDSDEDIGDGSGVRRVMECVPNMGSVTAPADAFRVGAPGPGGVESRKRPREPGSRRQQYAPPPPLSGSTVCLPRPRWVAPMRLSRRFGSSALCPRGGFPKLQRARPVSDPRLVRVLPPVVGFPPPQVGVGGGLWRPVFVMCPDRPRGPWGGRGPLRMSVWAPWLSAARRLMPRPPPPPPPPGPRVVAGLGCGRCASWSKVVGGGLGGGGWQWPGSNRRSEQWMWGTPRGGWVPHMPGDRQGRRPRQWKSCGRMGRWSWREQRVWVWGGGGSVEGSPPGLPEPDFPRDGGDTPVVPQFLMALPLYARVLALLSESACWLQRKLPAPGPLLMQRIELFVDRLFRVAEDFALVSALM